MTEIHIFSKDCKKSIELIEKALDLKPSVDIYTIAGGIYFVCNNFQNVCDAVHSRTDIQHFHERHSATMCSVKHTTGMQSSLVGRAIRAVHSDTHSFDIRRLHIRAIQFDVYTRRCRIVVADKI